MRINLNMNKIFILLGLMLLLKTVKAQQDPMFTQYNFNTQTFNPAYAGSWESLGFLALGRYQWVGLNGHPTTYTFSMQTPTRNENVAWGVNVISDKIGKEQHLTFSGDYSYRLRMGTNSYMRLGLKVGISNYSNPLTAYVQDPDSPTDPTLENIEAKTIPNFGIGAFWYSEDYYLGLSIPKILQTTFDTEYNYSAYSELRHFFLIGGYVFNKEHAIKIKPTFLLKVVGNAPIELDLTANFLIKDKVWLGAMYRTGDAYGFIAQWIIDQRLRLGYAIDFTTTELSRVSNGTHELMVSYEIGSRRKWLTPRMF